jgi:hypothetical protein
MGYTYTPDIIPTDTTSLFADKSTENMDAF